MHFGPEFEKRLDYWRVCGLSSRAARVLAQEGLDDPEAVRAKGRRFFVKTPNLGKKSLSEIERAIGGWGDIDAALNEANVAVLSYYGENAKDKAWAEKWLLAAYEAGKGIR